MLLRKEETRRRKESQSMKNKQVSAALVGLGVDQRKKSSKVTPK